MSHKKSERYFLVPTAIVVKEEGVSLFRLLREGDFSEELLNKYSKDVSDLLKEKLNRLVSVHNVPAKEVSRIKELMEELVHVTGLMQKNCDHLEELKN